VVRQAPEGTNFVNTVSIHVSVYAVHDHDQRTGAASTKKPSLHACHAVLRAPIMFRGDSLLCLCVSISWRQQQQSLEVLLTHPCVCPVLLSAKTSKLTAAHSGWCLKRSCTFATMRERKQHAAHDTWQKLTVSSNIACSLGMLQGQYPKGGLKLCHSSMICVAVEPSWRSMV
jgi:hypothetical protein